MRTTIDLPDELYRRTKAEAALRGRKFKDLVEDGLRRVLADACLVRLAEISGLPICTLDSDFEVYRANRRRRLALITPQLV